MGNAATSALPPPNSLGGQEGLHVSAGSKESGVSLDALPTRSSPKKTGSRKQTSERSKSRSIRRKISSSRSHSSRQHKPRWVKRTYEEGIQRYPDNPTIHAALRWVEAQNQHNMMKVYDSMDLDAIYYFPDTQVGLQMRPFWDSLVTLWEAFPDLAFTYSSAEEIQPGQVVLKDYRGFGYHTGRPCLLATTTADDGDTTSSQHAIPPTGALIANDPVHLTLHIKGGRIVELVATAISSEATTEMPTAATSSCSVADSSIATVGPLSGFYAKARRAHEKIVKSNKAKLMAEGVMRS